MARANAPSANAPSPFQTLIFISCPPFLNFSWDVSLRKISLPRVQSSRVRGCSRNAGGECLFQQTRVNAAGGTNRYDLGARCALAPLLLDGNVHAPADHLQHRPPLWRVRAVDHAFGPVNIPRQLA